MQDIAYKLNNSIYLNITNRCTNACSFCIRYKTRKFHGEHSLWLEHEPTAEEILESIGDPKQHDQIVFCGYGEPLIRLTTVKEVAAKLKDKMKKCKIRVDTNGQMNLFYGRNILPELKGLVDIISISLNAEKSDVYREICKSIFGGKEYAAVIEFIKEAKNHIPNVEISVVNMPEMIDIEKSKQIAKDLGVSFRVRSYYEEKYIP